MNAESLKSLLERFKDLSILVLGDFFLDRYLIIDAGLAETSIETGLEAHQVTEVRNSPGAAGTVTNNLCALGVGRVIALGFIGEDGHGFDLKNALSTTGVDTSHLIETSDRLTPTYTKPLRDGIELSRLDVKNRSTTPDHLQDKVIASLSDLYEQVDGIVVLDQVQELDCGVVTTRVRSSLEGLADANDRPVLADSRARIDRFRNVILKPNQDELYGLIDSQIPPRAMAAELARRTGRPAFITRGPDGIDASDGEATWRAGGIRVPDPIDIVGAGDSVSASVVAALAAGASIPEAARLGVIASSITVQQIGTTGTATPSQILTRFNETT